MTKFLLAIDQGTTNSRAIIFNEQGQLLAMHECALTQFFPQEGWVEQDAEEMYSKTVECCQSVLQQMNLAASQIAAIGISNQRETTIIWDKITGKAIYPAIVWQDRRTAQRCKEGLQLNFNEMIKAKTGLLLDPYFSATKIEWILQHVPNARERALKGELLFGTVETYLLYRLTGGKSHFTDISNAARTLLFNIHTANWDEDLLEFFAIPQSLLPKVLGNTADFGYTTADILGSPVAITGMAGDQQAATIGQACFHPGMVKTTLGTGAFMLMNTGKKPVASDASLLTTIAYQIDNTITYGLEGSIFCAGTTIKWLRDTLHLLNSAQETEILANELTTTEGVYLVPAFTGLGAPYWHPEARAAILGLTRNSDRRHIARAALESVAYQVKDVLSIMQQEGQAIETLRLDGGMAANNWLMQFMADILRAHVEKPTCIETSALGVAYLAGLQVGIFASTQAIEACWQQEKRFTPVMSAKVSAELYHGWQHAISQVLT